jgi:hypothetical protein
MTSARKAAPYEATVTLGTKAIGRVEGDSEGGYAAFAADGEKIEVFATVAAAHKAVFDRHKQEGRP